MFTDTLPTALTPLTAPELPPVKPLTPISHLSLSTLTGIANPQTSLDTYTRFRDLGKELIDTNSPGIYYRAYYNDEGSHNGEGVHEKFIYEGKSVLDVSMGLLDFPWWAADANPLNEITRDQLVVMANTETNPLIQWRLNVIAHFANTLMPHVRYYHFECQGVRALTMCDEFNGVKLNVILTHTEELVLSPAFG